jgi:DNA-binding protein YbaB
MSTGFGAQTDNPQLQEALRQVEMFTSTLDDQMRRAKTGSFSASDESETVHATVNSQRELTGLYIEEGVMRLGAETAELRINEALGKAQAAVTDFNAAQQKELVANLFKIGNDLLKTVEQP